MRSESTTARGYGSAHQRLRERWAVRVAAGGVCCARCGLGIAPGSEWHLDHDTHDRSRYLGPSHAYCNTTEPAKRRRRSAPRLSRFVNERWL